jgi:hypothetical protein
MKPGVRCALALLGALAALAVWSSPAQADPSEYGIESASASLSTAQAGAHPDVSIQFGLKTNPASAPDPTGLLEPFARTKDVKVELPPGLIGNPNTVPTCSGVQFATAFSGGGCPIASQVGVVVVHLYGFNTPFTEAIYNMEAPGGDTVARLGFYAANIPNFISVDVRTERESDYGLTASLENVDSSERLVGATTTLWGVPAASSHDRLRLTPPESFPSGLSETAPRSSGLAPEPFMTNPTSCGSSQAVTVTTDSYQQPGVFSAAAAPLPEMTGCAGLGFEPSLTVLPTSREAGAPTGLEADLTVPQNEGVEGFATSQLRDAVVTLPKGVAISPAAADGLAACSAAQVGFEASPPLAASCPEAAKIGSAEFDVPQLSRILNGAIYQRTPEAGDLFRIWLVSDELGVHVKIPGDIRVDKSSGQITSLFLGNPQVPLRELKLRFKSGSRAPLANPPACGTYQSRFEFAPWSGTTPVSGETPMTVDQGCGGAGFSPALAAGTVNPTAGAFSPLTTELSFGSGQQNPSSLEVTLPPGVLAKLAGVPVCEGAAAESAACPAASQVGTTTIATGPGTTPLWIPQAGREPTAVYLAGPYRGAPYSLVVKTPAQAGPFDLGTVVVRAGIYVDPATAQVTVKSDPLPQILEGVPISYRTIHVDVDRPEFTLNPTSCEPSAVRATLRSIDGAVATAQNRFQVGSCERLDFGPSLSLKLSGGTRRSRHPALKAVLTQPGGQANIARAAVTLPATEFIDQAHISNPCTRPQFAEGKCPPGSVLGKARAFSPLLDKPLEGPVYFRANGGERELPDVVADLGGQIHVVLVGFVDSVHHRGSEESRIRTTFAVVPDAPVSKFVLELNGGKKKGLLVNSQNLCRTKAGRSAAVKMTGQNGKTHDFDQPVANSCGRKRGRSRR